MQQFRSPLTSTCHSKAEVQSDTHVIHLAAHCCRSGRHGTVAAVARLVHGGVPCGAVHRVPRTGNLQLLRHEPRILACYCRQCELGGAFESDAGQNYFSGQAVPQADVANTQGGRLEGPCVALPSLSQESIMSSSSLLSFLVDHYHYQLAKPNYL